jgi:predicted dehydrogenase
MAKKLRYGFVGCGGIANGKHLPANARLQAEGVVELVAFCDIDIAAAQRANDKYAGGKGAVCTDYNQLVKMDLDVVFVLTPNSSHSQITVAALQAGKHVMCEKPMAISSQEADAMLAAQKSSGKLLTVGYQNRFRDDSVYLKAECDKGFFGDIYFAKATALRRRAVPTWGIFLDGQSQGGGPLIDIGTHALDLTLWMMDNYQPHYAVGTTYHKLNNDSNTGNAWGDWDKKKFTAEDSAFGFIVMKNGASIILQSSWALNTTDNREAVTTLCGTKAGVDMPKAGELEINGVKNGRQYITSPNFATSGVDFYGGKADNAGDIEARSFYNAIVGKSKLVVLPEQAAVVTRILEGIYKSAADGKPFYF